MNTGVVKAGGIAAFVTVALYILGMIIGGEVGIIFQIIGFILFIFSLISIKVCMNGLNYRRGDAMVWTLIALIVIMIVLTIIAGAVAAGTAMSAAKTGSMMNPQALLAALGIWFIILSLVLLALVIVFLLLGVRMNEFAGAGGGIWKGTGILTIIWSALILLAVVIAIIAALAKSPGFLVVTGILMIVGVIVFLASWIVLGIALLNSANKAPAAAT